MRITNKASVSFDIKSIDIIIYCTLSDKKIETACPMITFLACWKAQGMENQSVALSAAERPLESNFVESALTWGEMALPRRSSLGGKSQFGLETDGSLFLCKYL